MDNFRWRKAARLVASLDLILTTIWLTIIGGIISDRLANLKGLECRCESERCENFLSKIFFGCEKSLFLILYNLFDVILLGGKAFQLWNTFMLIRAMKSESTASEVLSKMSSIRPISTNYFFVDGWLYGSFNGNYILYGIYFVIKILSCEIISWFKSELEEAHSNRIRILRRARG